MAKKENLPTININGVDYTEDQLTDQQKLLVNHVVDLDRKIAQLKFNLDQLNVGRQAFMQLLEQDLAGEKSDPEKNSNGDIVG